MYGKAHEVRPAKGIGWHIWHNNSFSPFYRAEQDYAQFQKYSDFLKVVLYNNCGGPRLASYTKSMSRTLFGDLSPDEVLELTYKVQNYNGEAGAGLLRKGGSSQYVERGKRPAGSGVGDAAKKSSRVCIHIP